MTRMVTSFAYKTLTEICFSQDFEAQFETVLMLVGSAWQYFILKPPPLSVHHAPRLQRRQDVLLDLRLYGSLYIIVPCGLSVRVEGDGDKADMNWGVKTIGDEIAFTKTGAYGPIFRPLPTYN